MENLISQYGYLAVFVLMLAESACIPVPSEVVMMFGGALAAGAVGNAHPSLVGIFAAGVLGNVAGSYLSWAVGKYAGLAAVRRWGRRVGVREHEIDKATVWFERYGPVAVLIGRVIPVIRTFISLPAGFAEMPAGRFGIYTTLGAIPWTAALAVAGYALGAHWQQVAKDIQGSTYVIAGVLLVAIVAVVVTIVRRRRKAAASGASAGAGRDAEFAGAAREPMPREPMPREPVAREPGRREPDAWGEPGPGPRQRRPAPGEPSGYPPSRDYPPSPGYSEPVGYQPNRPGGDRW